MNLSLRIFGLEIATLKLDLSEEAPRGPTVVDKGTKAVSRWWVRHMVR